MTCGSRTNIESKIVSCIGLVPIPIKLHVPVYLFEQTLSLAYGYVNESKPPASILLQLMYIPNDAGLGSDSLPSLITTFLTFDYHLLNFSLQLPQDQSDRIKHFVIKMVHVTYSKPINIRKIQLWSDRRDQLELETNCVSQRTAQFYYNETCP